MKHVNDMQPVVRADENDYGYYVMTQPRETWQNVIDNLAEKDQVNGVYEYLCGTLAENSTADPLNIQLDAFECAEVFVILFDMEYVNG